MKNDRNVCFVMFIVFVCNTIILKYNLLMTLDTSRSCIFFFTNAIHIGVFYMVYAYHIKKAMVFFSIHIDTIDNDTDTRH